MMVNSISSKAKEDSKENLACQKESSAKSNLTMKGLLESLAYQKAQLLDLEVSNQEKLEQYWGMLVVMKNYGFLELNEVLALFGDFSARVAGLLYDEVK